MELVKSDSFVYATQFQNVLTHAIGYFFDNITLKKNKTDFVKK